MSWNFGKREGDIVEDNMVETVKNLFNYCSDKYKATTEGCSQIVEAWMKKCKQFDERFRNIPGFDAKNHCIVLDYKHLRETDPDQIYDFFNTFVAWWGGFDCRVIDTIDGHDKNWWYNEYTELDTLRDCINRLPANAINYHGAKEILELCEKAYKNYREVGVYTKESKDEYTARKNVLHVLRNITEQFCSKERAEEINQYDSRLKAAEGLKLSKLTRRWCKLIGIESAPNFEKRFARYADAINPLEVPEFLIISWNLLDFLTMSFGNSWTSCHSIDKKNVHGYTGDAADYRGCYSSGPLSYAEDMASVVVYSLPKTAKAPYWNIPKLRRQMFHISENGTTFIQGRLYPDDQSDCGRNTEFTAYKQWREIVQEVISKAYDIPNLWKNERGADSCSERTISNGTHYRDYEHYSNVNISYLENKQETILIGKDPICPSCGESHDETHWCTCEHCREGWVRCASCGEYEPIDNLHLCDDGEYRCDDCCTYCEYHNAYESNRNNFTYLRLW